MNNGSWLWGVKALYQFVNANPRDSNVSLPQAGEFTPQGGSPDDFTGYVAIGSIQTSITHEFALIPFFGYSFQHSYVYGGVGPALLGTTTRVNDAIGYATINGTLDDITGGAIYFSKPRWL